MADGESERGGDTPRALIVDDNALHATLAAEVLATLGCRSRWAADGRSALAVVSGDDPLDVLLVDLHLPNLAGADVAREARRLRPGLSLKVVGISADGLRSHRAAALAAGMDRVVTKPARLADLRAVLRELGVVPVWFDTGPLVEARSLVVRGGDPAQVAALLEPSYAEACTLADKLRDDSAQRALFLRVHANLVNGLLYAIELARHTPGDERRLGYVVRLLDRAIAWEDV